MSGEGMIPADSAWQAGDGAAMDCTAQASTGGDVVMADELEELDDVVEREMVRMYGQMQQMVSISRRNDQPPSRWEIDALDTKREVEVPVAVAFPPNDAMGFLAWAKAAVKSVPVEYRANSTIKLDTESDYDGDSSVRIEVTYKRPETDEEYAQRRTDVFRRLDLFETTERMKLAELQAKYGAQP